MSSEEDKRNTELTRKTNENAPKSQKSYNDNQDMNKSVEDAEGNLERTQNNQKDAAKENNPQSETGPAETLRSKAAKAEDKSEDSKEPA